jgi:hypothetical protein
MGGSPIVGSSSHPKVLPLAEIIAYTLCFNKPRPAFNKPNLRFN